MKGFIIPDSEEPQRKNLVVGAVFDKRTGRPLEKWENPEAWEADKPEVTVRKLGRRDLVARILHVCDCCKSTIEKGQKYTRIFFLVNGKPSILKYHYTEPVPEDNCRWKGTA